MNGTASLDPLAIDDGPAHGQLGVGDTRSDHRSGERSPGHPDVGGLAISADGYRIVVEKAGLGDFAFAIEGPDGRAVTAFDMAHEKRLHLVIASRDLTSYAHLHPEMDEHGHWTATIPELAPGAYRAFADFRPTGGPATTLGIDLTDPGRVATRAPLAPRSIDRIDGYEVRLDGEPIARRTTTVGLAVNLDGRAVTTDPYLGARGHLVALRDGDLGYLHVHPLPDEGDSTVRFAIHVPTGGTYGLFFDFAHDGEVHTARFVIDVPSETTDSPARAGDGRSHHDH